jgi:hypothetical protein
MQDSLKLVELNLRHVAIRVALQGHFEGGSLVTCSRGVLHLTRLEHL